MQVSWKYGVHELVTQSNASTLENATYHVRTELGVAENGYKHYHEFPIYGTGQGSGNSPMMIWFFISCLLFDLYDQLAHPALYCTPDRLNAMQLALIGFVDDNNGQTNNFMEDEDDDTVPELMSRTRNNAQIWADILGAS